MSLKHKILLLLSSLTLVCLLLFITFSDKGLADLTRQRRLRDNLLRQNQNIIQENLTLIRTIERLKNDPGFIENVARQELGMIGRNEVIFKFQSEKEMAP